MHIYLCVGMVVNFPKDELPKELAALVVDITLNKSNCAIMIQVCIWAFVYDMGFLL